MRFGSVELLFFLLFTFSPIDTLADINTAEIVYDENSSVGLRDKPLCIAAPSAVEYSTQTTNLFYSVPTDLASFDNRSVSQPAGVVNYSIISIAIEKIKALFDAGAAHVNSGASSSTALLFGTGIIGLIGISRKS